MLPLVMPPVLLVLVLVLRLALELVPRALGLDGCLVCWQGAPLCPQSRFRLLSRRVL